MEATVDGLDVIIASVEPSGARDSAGRVELDTRTIHKLSAKLVQVVRTFTSSDDRTRADLKFDDESRLDRPRQP